MIRPLRTQHLWTFAVLGFVLPTVFVTGLTARRSSSTAPMAAVASASELKSKNFSIGFDVEDTAGKHRVRFSRSTYALAPDVLVYWSASGAMDLTGATLLGPLSAGSSYDLPENGGMLIIYSVGHQKTIASAPLGGRP